jgi:hypothetical protein
VTWFVLTDTKGDRSPDDGEVWLEGWSRSPRRKLYSLTFYDAEMAWDPTLLRTAETTLCVGMSHLTCALDLREGRIRWEVPLKGDLMTRHERFLFLRPRDGIQVLDAASGDVLACYVLEGSQRYGRDSLRVVDGQIHAVRMIHGKGDRPDRTVLFVLRLPERTLR